MSRREQGAAALSMVMLLLAIGLGMVNGLAGQLARQLPTLRLSRDAVQAMSAVLSLQAQALQLPWQAGAEGTRYCQRLNHEQGQACLESIKGGRWLLQVTLNADRPAPTLWRWVIVADGRLQAQRAGWSDLCPLQAQACR